MTEYFEDMWLDLEKELSSYDSYSNDFSNYNSMSTSPQLEEGFDSSTTEVSPQTYENLLQTQEAPNPSRERLHSSSREERIQAIKELYNKVPTIINGNISVERITKIANGLSRIGLVKQSNDLITQLDQLKRSAGDSVDKLSRVADNLARKGLVKQSEELNEFISRHFSYSQNTKK